MSSNSVPSLSLAWASTARPPRSFPRQPADGVEIFQGEAEGIDPLMAHGAFLATGVFLHLLANGEADPRHLPRREVLAHSPGGAAASRPAAFRRPSCRAAPDWSATRRTASPGRSPGPGCRRGRISAPPRPAATAARSRPECRNVSPVFHSGTYSRHRESDVTGRSFWKRS